ncbi:MAG: CoA-binding protein [Candidatus Moranbacteria bacterium]|nr:CoA-binding protein [Candidatus Moranbacteria bacterium]
MDLQKLFNPSSIAIVGASEEAGKVGNVIAKNVLELGYAGKVFLVNPKYDELFGRKCYKNLSEVEEPVDLVIISIPGKFVAAEIRNNADRHKNYVIVSSGFSEIGEAGKIREEEILKIASENGLSILGPNCLGFIVPRLKLNASFASGISEEGNVALVSQSGALAVALMDSAKGMDLKFSSVISVGNKMQISETELMEYLAEDENTKVIAMYLEGIKDGKKFLEAASKVSAKKPIVVLKAGKTEKSQKAISSHTGALAGSDDIMDVAFRKCGVLRAESLEEFFEIVSFISLEGFPKNGKVAVITNAGGPGVLTADAFLGKSVALHEFDEKTKEKFRKFLPEESSLGNPIDMLGDAKEDRYRKTLSLLDKDPEVGTVLAILTPQDQTPVAKVASVLSKFKEKSDKVILASFIGGERIKKGLKKLSDNGVPQFSFPENAVKALDAAYSWSLGRNGYVPADGKENTERKEKALLVIRNAKHEGRNALFFSEAKEIMEMYGVRCSDAREIGPGEKEVLIDFFPSVLKVDSDKVIHKTDKKGVVLDIENQESFDAAVNDLRREFYGAHLVAQPMLSKGMELIFGIKKDPIFGPIVICGLGGIYTEIFKMVDFFIPPFGEGEIKKLLMSGKTKFLFEETRGQKPYDIDEVVGIIKGIGDFSREVDEFSEFDINPLIVYNDGKAAVAVDVKIIL